MRTIDVYLDGENIDTIFWYGKKDSLLDIKKSLVDHDGYDFDITLIEVVDENVYW